ncbi:2OG-Fe(II) oxygenase family protein [Pseudoalteromonas maricaloris]|uniref:2OG-Fe(II) oxygenase family protein n=1 Tax=Pseudoalteromonas maricaloris TaxID=184924 RepID=UPI003C28E28B
MPNFKYFSFDLKGYFSDDVINNIRMFALANMENVKLQPDSVTSRESENVKNIDSLVVDGNKIRKSFPFLFDLYENEVLELVRNSFFDNPVLASNDLYAINLNIQYGNSMRYECHVDSNPIQGVLYLTEHTEGGELIVSHEQSAVGVDEISLNCVTIKPEVGMLYLFDGRKNPHFVNSLKKEKDLRIAVTMNFYTNECNEEQRPTDLNEHLFNN